MEENITLKGFWGRLFCKHDYTTIGKLKIYSSIEEKNAELPSREYLRFMCKKCGKIRKFRVY